MPALNFQDTPGWFGGDAHAAAILRLPEAHVLQAEGLLVSSALERLGFFYACRPLVGSGDFCQVSFGATWRALEELDDAGALDALGRDAPSEALRKLVAAHILQTFEGPARFVANVRAFELWASQIDALGVAVAPQLQSLARRVREAARCRRLARATVEARSHLDRSARDPAGGFLRATQALEAGVSEAGGASGRATAAEAVARSHEAIMARRARRLAGERQPLSGSYTFDRIAGGLVPGDLWILGGRPGSGKTAEMNQMVRFTGYDGSGSVMFSLEMSEAQQLERMAAADSGVFLGKLKTGDITDMDCAELAKAHSRMHALPFVIDPESALSVEEIALRLHRDAATWERRFPGCPLRLCAIDHLHCLGQSPGQRDERSHLGRAAVALKGLAKSLGITIVLLSHLNREADKRGPPYKMGDLYGSGVIEGIADVVAIYAPLSLDPVREVGVHVVKSRHGGEGVSTLTFDGRIQVFYETNP